MDLDKMSKAQLELLIKKANESLTEKNTPKWELSNEFNDMVEDMIGLDRFAIQTSIKVDTIAWFYLESDLEELNQNYVLEDDGPGTENMTSDLI